MQQVVSENTINTHFKFRRIYDIFWVTPILKLDMYTVQESWYDVTTHSILIPDIYTCVCTSLSLTLSALSPPYESSLFEVVVVLVILVVVDVLVFFN